MDVLGVCSAGVGAAVHECVTEWLSAVSECEACAVVCLAVVGETTDGGCGGVCAGCVFGDGVIEF